MDMLQLQSPAALVPAAAPYSQHRMPPYRFRKHRVRRPLYARRTVGRRRNVLYSPERAAAWMREHGRGA